MDDILVGYRWHDTKKIAPLFVFGHGLGARGRQREGEIETRSMKPAAGYWLLATGCWQEPENLKDSVTLKVSNLNNPGRSAAEPGVGRETRIQAHLPVRIEIQMPYAPQGVC